MHKIGVSIVNTVCMYAKMLALLRIKVSSSRQVLAFARCHLSLTQRQYSADSSAKVQPFISYGTADPGPQFLNRETQALLKSLTRLDVGRIFRKRFVKETTLQFKFMTTEQIQEEVETALQRAEVKLQMPPVMKVKEERIETLSKDPALKSFDDSDYVFTDITYGVPDAERNIIIRSTDGTLSTASLEVRKRLNQFYFPLNGRRVREPKVFEADNLKVLLAQDAFEFLLDTMCIQFEPYERKFHDISAAVYEYIDEHKKFDALRSTRHFGPMAFFLSWHNRTDNLLLDLIKNDYLDNCVDLVELSCRLHNWPLPTADKLNRFRELASQTNATISTAMRGERSLMNMEIEGSVGKVASQIEADRIAMEVIESFVREHSVKKVQLELAIQTYVERSEGQRKLLQGLQTAHGLNE